MRITFDTNINIKYENMEDFEIKFIIKHNPKLAVKIYKENYYPLELKDMIEFNILHKYFMDWWDENATFQLSDFLCRNFTEYFDIWWNPEKFDWQHNSEGLTRCCSEHFDKWWNPEKINWTFASLTLCKFNHKKFDKWWDPDKFDWEYVEYLKIYCFRYKDIWGPDYALRQIM